MSEINRVRTWSLIKIFRVVFGFPFIVIGLLGFCFSLYDTLDSRNSDIEGSFFIFLRSSLVLVFGLLLAFACSEKVIDRKKRSIIHTWRVLVPLRRKVYSIPNEAIVTVISEERSVKGGASEMEVQAHVPFMLFT